MDFELKLPPDDKPEACVSVEVFILVLEGRFGNHLISLEAKPALRLVSISFIVSRCAEFNLLLFSTYIDFFKVSASLFLAFKSPSKQYPF